MIEEMKIHADKLNFCWLIEVSGFAFRYSGINTAISGRDEPGEQIDFK